MDLNPLYDIGYNDFKKADELFAAIRASKGYLVDVRFSPRARNAAFNGTYIEKMLKGQYVYCHNLGNENYKGGPTKLVNAQEGILTVLGLLAAGPVFLMCACWSRENCHRLEIANLINQQHGIQSTGFTPAMARTLTASTEGIQPKLL